MDLMKANFGCYVHNKKFKTLVAILLGISTYLTIQIVITLIDQATEKLMSL